MATSLEHRFTVGDRQFVFDGNTLGIYEYTEGGQAAKAPSNGSDFDNNRGTYLRSLALNLTNNCNLECGYCYACQGKYDNPGVVMSEETAFRSVDLLIDSVARHDGKVLTIGFFGGEPLMAFDLIEKIVEYANRRVPQGVSARYLLTTNGTLLKPEHLGLMTKNQFQVMLSIDGDEQAHNAYRKYPNGRGSYNHVARAAKILLDNVQVEARITIADRNTAIDKAVEHILTLGIGRITYALDYKLSTDGFEQFMVSLENLFANYRASIARGEYFDLSNATEPIAAIVLKKKKRTHCNAGVSYMSVSAEGNLYRCPRFTGNKHFMLGTVQQSGGLEVSDAIEQFKGSLKQSAKGRTLDCANCVFAYLCGGICYHHAFSAVGDEFAAVPRECVYRRQLFHLVLELLCSLTISERRGFLLYLNKFWQRERG